MPIFLKKKVPSVLSLCSTLEKKSTQAENVYYSNTVMLIKMRKESKRLTFKSFYNGHLSYIQFKSQYLMLPIFLKKGALSMVIMLYTGEKVHIGEKCNIMLLLLRR